MLSCLIFKFEAYKYFLFIDQMYFFLFAISLMIEIMPFNPDYEKKIEFRWN
jgi:hypothetical protein